MQMENVIYKNIKSDKIPQGRIIAVCSGTKGIGKTWMATNLCHNLALLKKKMLFFDADCSVENIAYQLGLDCFQNFGGLVSGSLTLNNAVFSFDKGKFDIIAGRSGDNALKNAPVGRLQLIAGDLKYLAKFYDFTFLDCSNDMTATANAFFNVCTNIIVLVNADSASATAAYRKLEELKSIKPDTVFQVIVNRAFSFDEGLQIFKTLRNAADRFIKTEIKLLGIIRQDARIRDAVINQSLLLNRYPTCEGCADMLALAHRIAEEF